MFEPLNVYFPLQKHFFPAISDYVIQYHQIIIYIFYLSLLDAISITLTLTI